SSLGDGKHRIQNSLTRNQRNRGGVAVQRRTRHADRPFLAQRQRLFRPVRELQRYDGVQNRIFSVRNHMPDSALQLRRYHGLMHNGMGFLSLGNDSSAAYLLTL